MPTGGHRDDHPLVALCPTVVALLTLPVSDMVTASRGTVLENMIYVRCLSTSGTICPCLQAMYLEQS